MYFVPSERDIVQCRGGGESPCENLVMSQHPAVAAVSAAPMSADDGQSAVESGVNNATNIFTGFFEAIGNNGYQTGTALIALTVVLVIMVNLKTNNIIAAGVSIGAFWAGWLGWNTVTDNDNQLFPGDVQSTRLWDVAFTSDMGFLFVAAVGCVLAFFLWRKGTSTLNRVLLFVGGILGASLLYNIFESIRAT